MKKDSEFIQQVREKKRIEKEKLAHMNLREKADYIWTYYKLAIIIAVIVIASMVSIVRYALSDKKENLMYSIVVNADYFSIQEETEDGADQPALFLNFMRDAGYDPAKYQIDANTALMFDSSEDPAYGDPQSYAVLTTLLMSGTTDNILADQNVFDSVSKTGILLPLEEYLSAEELKENEDHFVYATDPESGKKVACGIHLEDSKAIAESSMFYTPPIVGVINGSPHQDASIEFVRYLLKE